MIKKFLVAIIILALFVSAMLVYWAHRPILASGEPPIEFAIKPGSGVRSSADQIAEAGVPLNPTLFHLLARFSGKSTRLKAGNYELKPGTTPMALIDQLVRGEFAQESLAIIEGWTFKQMRQAIDAHPKIRHDTVGLSDKELLAKISPEYKHPEGLFFPDTYLFAKGSSDLQIYKQAHALLQKRLEEAWNKRAPNVPYKSPYEALIMASIVEKETGQKSERNMIAAVFVNRLRLGMLLQTDPTVIYGMGALAPNAMAREAQHHVRILMSPTDEAFVESIDRHVVAAPDRQVAALDAVPFDCAVVAHAGVRKMQQRHDLVGIAGQALAQPVAQAALVDRIGGRQDFLRERLGQQHAAARHHESLFRQQAVPGDVVRTGDAVAVEENQVFALGRVHAEVARGRCSETVVGLPGMHQPFHAAGMRRVAKGGQGVARGLAGTVIGDDDLEVRVRLVEQGADHGGQRIGAVVGGDDDRDQHVLIALHGKPHQAARKLRASIPDCLAFP